MKTIPWEFANVVWKCDKCGWIGRFEDIGQCKHGNFTTTKEPIPTEQEKRKAEVNRILDEENNRRMPYYNSLKKKRKK